MTDKQIIIDGEIKPITLEDVPTILELHKSKSFVEIAKMYGVTQNAIRYWVKKYNVKPLKQKDQIKILEEQLKQAEKTMQEIWDRLGKTSDELLRKEQECEELKIYIESNEQQVKEVEKLVMDNDRLINELDQLKAENDELKKKCNIYTCGICGNKEDCNKLYKILTEIKEIAEHCINQDICTTCDNSDKCHIEDEEIPTYDVCKLILQKISECEGNDE